jgi:hypothetical protein
MTHTNEEATGFAGKLETQSLGRFANRLNNRDLGGWARQFREAFGVILTWTPKSGPGKLILAMNMLLSAPGAGESRKQCR